MHNHLMDLPRLKRDKYLSLRLCISEECIEVELGKGVMVWKKGENKLRLRKSRRTTRKVTFGMFRDAKCM